MSGDDAGTKRGRVIDLTEDSSEEDDESDAAEEKRAKISSAEIPVDMTGEDDDEEEQPRGRPRKLDYAWRLFRTEELGGGAGNEGCVTMSEALAGPTPDFMVISNMIIDATWLSTALPKLQEVKRILVFHGRKDDLDDVAKRLLPNHVKYHRRIPSELKFFHPETKNRVKMEYGCHHSKFFLVGFPSGLRVVIHTANLIYIDLHNKSNGLYVQDFPPKTQQGSSDFEDSLVDYMETLAVHGGFANEEQTWAGAAHHNKPSVKLADALRRYDFSGARASLVPTVPGYHRGNDLEKYGQLRLKKLLTEESNFEAQDPTDKIVFQFSSFSGADKNFRADLSQSFSAGFFTKNNAPLDRREGLREVDFVWPSREEIRMGIDGYAAGASLPSETKSVKNVPREHLHTWRSPTSTTCPFIKARERATPHIKTLTRLSSDGRKVAWSLLTSANLSGAAWGRIQQKGAQLYAMHWELGVLFTPSTLSKPDNFSCHTTTTTIPRAPLANTLVTTLGIDDDDDDNNVGKVVVPIPYALPLNPYPPSQRPWCDLTAKEEEKVDQTSAYSLEPWHWDGEWPTEPDLYGRSSCAVPPGFMYGRECAPPPPPS